MLLKPVLPPTFSSLYTFLSSRPRRECKASQSAFVGKCQPAGASVLAASQSYRQPYSTLFPSLSSYTQTLPLEGVLDMLSAIITWSPIFIILCVDPSVSLKVPCPHTWQMPSLNLCILLRILPHFEHFSQSLVQECWFSSVLPHLAHLSQSFDQSWLSSPKIEPHLAHLLQSADTSCSASLILPHIVHLQPSHV